MKSHTLNYAAIALCLTFGVAAHAQTMTKVELKDAKAKIEADYKAALVPCASLSGNAKKICTVEAKGNEKIALANLEAANKPSAKSQRDASDTKADAAYALAKQKCDDVAGNTKDVCIKEAKSVEATAKADARKTTAQATSKASEKVTDARNDAAIEKTDAQYKVEKEKCDVLAGPAKDSCLTQAKTRFGK